MVLISLKDALRHISSVILMVLIIRIIGRIAITLWGTIQWESFVTYITQIYSSAFFLYLISGMIFGFLSGYARVYSLQGSVFFKDYFILAVLGFLGSIAGDLIYVTLDYTKSYIQVLPGDLPLIINLLILPMCFFAVLFFIGSFSCSILLKYPKWRIIKE
jgi:H+/Cl- antiporter ClcA